MKRIKNRPILLAVVVGLVTMMGMVATSPALANSIFLDRLRADPQSVTVQDANGTHRGILYADLKGLPDGSASGPTSLQVGNKYYEFDFDEVTEIRLGADGRPEGISLKGTGTMTEDGMGMQYLELQATIDMERDDDVLAPIWKIVGDCVLDTTVIGEVVDVTVMYLSGGESE